jgi:hypothetical protein
MTEKEVLEIVAASSKPAPKKKAASKKWTFPIPS